MVRGELTGHRAQNLCFLGIFKCYLGSAWIHATTLPRLCTHTGRSGRVALGTLQDTQEKQFVPFCFCLAGLSAPGCLQGMRQADAEISHAVESARLWRNIS